MALDRDAILGLDDLPREEVFVKEWDGSVYVRALTGRERDQLEQVLTSGNLSRAKIVAFVAVDENGDKLFTEDDVEALSDKNGAALETIVTAAMKANALADDDIEEVKND